MPNSLGLSDERRSPRMAALEVRGGGFSRGLGVLWRDVFGRRTREHLLPRLELGDSRRAVRPRVDADFLPGNERLIRGLHDRELLDAAIDIDEDLVRLLLRRGSFDLLADDRACDTGNRTCDIRSAAAAHGMPQGVADEPAADRAERRLAPLDRGFPHFHDGPFLDDPRAARIGARIHRARVTRTPSQ